MNDKNFVKKKHYSHHKHIAMYPCTKFQLIWRTSYFGTKSTQKTMSKKFREFQFREFREFQFLRPNLPKKHFRMEYLDKCTQPENNLF